MTIKKRKRGGGKKKRFAIKDAAGAAFCIALPIYPNPKSLSCLIFFLKDDRKKKTYIQIKESALHRVASSFTVVQKYPKKVSFLKVNQTHMV